MKKMIVMASLATILGLSFYSATHTSVDGVGEKNEDKTYIVTVGGDLVNDDAATLKKYRNEVLNQIAYELPEGSYEVTNVYDTVLNGFSIKVNSAYASTIEAIKGVSALEQAHTYALPDVEESTGTSTTYGEGDKGQDNKAERLTNYSAQTMEATADDVKSVTGSDSYGGKNVTIGIIDTGLYLNQVVGTNARSSAESKYGNQLNAAAFKDLSEGDYSYTNDMVLEKGFSATYYTHLNNKIFFARDYAGKDNDVDPTSNGSNHGTHVASIAAANGDDFQGIAPNAQVAVLKVFGDNDGGASSDAIIAALNDAAKLKLDIVNLSLGSDLYVSNDSTDDSTYEAIKNATNAGVIVNFAAGNSGKSSFSSSKTYSGWTRDTVETGILGSDAHFDEEANIVAASTPNTAFYESILSVKQNGSETSAAVSYSDQAVPSTTQTGLTNRPLAGLIPEGESDVTLDYVVIPNYGKNADYEGLDVNGKVAVVNRGTTTFVAKVKQAAAHGAKAMICINNTPSVTFNFSMAFEDYDPPIPVVFVFKNTATYFGKGGSTGTITIGQNTVQTASDGNTIASFSSDGGEYNLDMGITVSAPGKEIIGAVDATAYNDNSDSSNPGYSLLHGYENESGTSMACPNLTGALALYLGEKNPTNNGSLKTTDFAEEKKKASYKAMSSADQLLDTTGSGTPNSPRMQGAGRVNVKKMLSADSYVTTPNNDLGGFDNTVEAKAELKNTGSLKVEDGNFATDTSANYIEFEYTIYNDSDTERSYKPSLSVMVPSLEIQITHDEYQEEETSSRKETIGYDDSVTFNANDASTYPYGVGQVTSTVNDDLLTIPEDHQMTGTISVAAHSSTSGKVKVRIDDLHIDKDWGDSMVENFSGTLKEYFAKYFSEAGGNYVEGYLTLEETSGNSDLNLSMPYMGFYGDYSVADAVEDFDIEREDGKLYNSDLVDNYMQNLNDNYKKSSAYTGSTLSATGSAVTGTKLTNLGAMNTSAKADGVNYLSVTDGNDPTHIYAGATGISDHLISVFFVNRSLKEATWTIKNNSGAVAASGTIGDLYYYGGTWTDTKSGEICKSWLVTGDNSQPYFVHRGFSDISLSSLEEGDYTLTYSFKVAGLTTDNIQEKSYTLTIDRTSPELKGLVAGKTSSGKDTIQVLAEGATNTASMNITASQKTTKVEGSDNLYTATFNVTDAWKKNDKIYLEVTDYAHNSLNVIIHPSDLTFSVASTFFTSKNDYTIDAISSKNGNTTYQVTILDAKGSEATLRSGYTVYVQLNSNLDKSDIKVTVGGEDATFTYDADTGMLAIEMGKDDTSFTINQTPKSQGGDTTDSGSTSDKTTDSGSTSDNSSSKKGCFGSVATVSCTLGAIALLTGAIALKKKKEDK